MKINLIAVGKIKESYYSSAVSEYAKRISRFADFSVVEIPDAPQSKTPEEQSRIEGERLLEKAKGYIILLDGRGTELSSEDLAALINKKCIDGEGEFSFLIGGSHGHNADTRKKADFVLSFGKMTFPHQMFRVMASEQIYRAMTINAGLPYHK